MIQGENAEFATLELAFNSGRKLDVANVSAFRLIRPVRRILKTL